MSITKTIKTMFSDEDQSQDPVAPVPVELTVNEITKDLVTTMAKLDTRSKALELKAAEAEATAIAAMEAKRKALAEQLDAVNLSKKISDLVSAGVPPAAGLPAAQAAQPAQPAVSGANGALTVRA